MSGLMFDRESERDAVPEQLFEAAIGAINGTALSAALLTAATVLIRRPDILFCSLYINVIEIFLLVLLGFASFGLNIFVFIRRLSRLAVGRCSKILFSVPLIAVLVPLAIALIYSAHAQLPNLTPNKATHPACFAYGEAISNYFAPTPLRRSV